MYIDNPSLKKPNINAKIWRYMDYWKFRDMLKSSSLHFTRIDKLNDSLEGTWEPSGAFKAYESYGKKYIDSLKYWEKVFRTTGAVNCWHINELESKEMWDEYVNENDGVAIRSTFSSLMKALDKSEQKVYIGTMEYINYESDSFSDCSSISFGNFTTFFHYKDRSFRHENELRALIMAIGTVSEPAKPLDIDGTKVNVELTDVIEEVYTPKHNIDKVQNDLQANQISVRVVPLSFLKKKLT